MMNEVETLQALLPEAAARYHDQLAVDFRGRQESYGSLYALANRVAQTLQQRGICPGQRVVVCLNKSVEAMASMYAVHLCGAVYVPVDPIAPPGRIIRLITDVDAAGLLIAPRILEILQGVVEEWSPPPVVLHPSGDFTPGSLPSVGLAQTQSSSESPAYQLYTSGSSGFPKGVVHTHGSALAFAKWAAHTFELTPEDRVANHAGLHFDLSTFDYLSACLAGAAVCPVPESMSFHGEQLISFIQSQEITVWYSVPLALRRMLEASSADELGRSKLRCVLFAGEVFPTAEIHRLREILPDVRLVNLYGPTETNVCLWKEIEDEDLEKPFHPVPIGKPCPGVSLWFHGDEAGAQKGDLCVHGSTLMKEYWASPDDTARAFVPPPPGFADDIQGYRTGDLVMRDEKGNYHFLGRMDQQVKIRGFRVELGEIEAVLQETLGVLRAIAVAPSDQKGIQRIEAFIRLGSAVGERSDDEAIREISKYCVDQLPMHMVPTRIHVVDVFPLTSNGKVDRWALTRRCESSPDSL